MLTQALVSEVDLMSAIYPLNIHRRIEWQWVERIKSPRRIRGLVVTVTEGALQNAFNDDAPIPAPSRSVVDPVQLGPQPRD
jgi:hypothetical protein